MGQSVLDWQVTVVPAGQSMPGEDGFGNAIELLTVTVPHSEVVITARGTVDGRGAAAVSFGGLSEPVPQGVYLRRTALTMPDDDIKGIVAATAGLDRIPRLHAMMGAIRDRVEYRTGSTGAHTTAAEALADGIGVCQDHAHIFISAARAAAIPARYVTGYLLIDDDTSVAEATHAWAEAWVDGPGLGRLRRRQPDLSDRSLRTDGSRARCALCSTDPRLAIRR